MASPHSALDRGPAAQGGCKPLHGRLRGPWLPSPVTDLDGYQGGPEGAPEQPAPMQLPYRDSRFHSRLPASCCPSSPATLPLPGGRNLPGPGRVPDGSMQVEWMILWRFTETKRAPAWHLHETAVAWGHGSLTRSHSCPIRAAALLCDTYYENVHVRKLPSVVPQRKQTWSMQSWSLRCREAMGSLTLCPEGSSPT